LAEKRAAMRQGRLARTGIEHRHELLGATDRAKPEKPPPIIFCQRRQIGLDIPQPLRAAIADPEGNDFIEDQECADLARDVA